MMLERPGPPILEGAVASSPHRGFAHRENSNGTTDSICQECFVAVASSRWEAELELAEKKHVCDPEVLQFWKNLVKSVPVRPPIN